MNATAAQGKGRNGEIFELVCKSGQDPVQNAAVKKPLSKSLGHCNVIRFNSLIRTAEFSILLPNLKKSSVLKWGVQTKEIERTICKGKVHLDVIGIILILKHQIRVSVKIRTAISKQISMRK